jgi:hypothetical protein
MAERAAQMAEWEAELTARNKEWAARRGMSDADPAEIRRLIMSSVDNFVRNRQPQPQEHCANQEPHIDSLCERKKPTPRKDESQIHLESKSDTPHELSEDILLSNNLTSTPLVLSSPLLGCSDDDVVLSMEMRDSTICEMSESTIREMSDSTICESECFHFASMSDTPSETRVVVDRSSEAILISNNLPSTLSVFSHVLLDPMDEVTPTLDKIYMVHTLDDNTPCLEDDEHVDHMEPLLQQYLHQRSATTKVIT